MQRSQQLWEPGFKATVILVFIHIKTSLEFSAPINPCTLNARIYSEVESLVIVGKEVKHCWVAGLQYYN